MQYTPDNKFNIQNFPTYLNCKLQVNQYAIKPLVAHQLTKTVSIVQVSWFTRGYFVFHFDFMDLNHWYCRIDTRIKCEP